MFDRLRAAARGNQPEPKATDANAGLRVLHTHHDDGVVSTQYYRNGMYTPTPPNPEGLMVNPTKYPVLPGEVSEKPRVMSQKWYHDGKQVSSEEWYQNGQPRPGGVKAAAAAAAAKAAEPKTAKPKAADRGDER